LVAHDVITSNVEGKYEGWLRIRLGSLDQTIILVPKARHFGGYQWYFVCPVMNRYASVLWLLSGAGRFCSRQAWGRRVAYASQFLDPDNRAHRAQAKIKARLIAGLDPDEWDLPPKPKWMGWRTYGRYVQKFDAYEDILSQKIAELMGPLPKWELDKGFRFITEAGYRKGR
jgi:hypothetical protein